MINYFNTPSADLLAEFLDMRVNVVRWVDIYEEDGTTLWRSQVAPIGGAVAADMGRDERRNIDVQFANENGELNYGPGELWYDKVLKPYRGIDLGGGDIWVTPLGEFMIDTINRPHFPNTVAITGRDYTKKLLMSKFAETTMFTAGTNIGEIVKAVALNAGITKLLFTPTDRTLDEDVTFDRASQRFPAMKSLSESISFQVYFNNFGYLVFEPMVDPLTAPISVTFTDEGNQANLASFTLSTNDNEIKNDVIVYSENDEYPLVYGHAENTNPASPTSIAQIGRRTFERPSALVTNNADAQALAEAHLAVAALESYDLSLAALVLPWLEPGVAVESVLSNRALTDPTRYLLSSISIPLELGTMSASTRRITIVG